MKVVVYGHTGVVGAQLFRWLSEQGLAPAGVSLDERVGDASEPDWAFLCLPTPTGPDGQDLSAIEDVAAQLAGRDVNVVIRSTVLPGTCARLQVEHPEWRVYHWPEFLSARTAWEDFCDPRIQIVGQDKTGYLAQHWDRVWGGWLPPAESGTKHVSLETAEMIKYAHNLHGAMQVIYANLIEDMMIQAGNVHRDMLTWAMVDLGYVKADTILAYWNVKKDGYRGYGGACFPKDVDAIRHWLAGKVELLDGMAAANARLRAES